MAFVFHRRREGRVVRQDSSLNHLRERETLSRYRLSKMAIHELTRMVTPALVRHTKMTKSIPVLTLARNIFLQFYKSY